MNKYDIMIEQAVIDCRKAISAFDYLMENVELENMQIELDAIASGSYTAESVSYLMEANKEQASDKEGGIIATIWKKLCDLCNWIRSKFKKEGTDNPQQAVEELVDKESGKIQLYGRTAYAVEEAYKLAPIVKKWGSTLKSKDLSKISVLAFSAQTEFKFVDDCLGKIAQMYLDKNANQYRDVSTKIIEVPKNKVTIILWCIDNITNWANAIGNIVGGFKAGKLAGKLMEAAADKADSKNTTDKLEGAGTVGKYLSKIVTALNKLWTKIKTEARILKDKVADRKNAAIEKRKAKKAAKESYFDDMMDDYDPYFEDYRFDDDDDDFDFDLNFGRRNRFSY